jgi:hypothetical protein
LYYTDRDGCKSGFPHRKKERKNKLDFFASISNRRKGFETSDPILKNKVGQTASKHSPTKKHVKNTGQIEMDKW